MAIAAVTATLRDLLTKGVGGTVNVRPLDRVLETDGSNQLNLFLYQVLPNAAWRNMDISAQVRPGETATSPLALTLHYLLTAFSNDGIESHQMLGRAMGVLYDHCILDGDQIRNASQASVPGNDLDRQVEHVRITLQPMSLDELSKLWPGFQASYRLSVAYEVSVVLIESTRPAAAPLPVLTRSVRAFADLQPFPAIESIVPPADPDRVRLGERLTIRGAHLGGAGVVRFTSARQPAPWELPPLGGTSDTQLQVQLPADAATAANQPAGVYSLSVVFDVGTPTEHSTNTVPIMLAPSIQQVAPAVAPRGSIAFTVTCAPQIWPEQRASLLIQGREFLADAHTTKTATPSFGCAVDSPGNAVVVRLRVDGVDSVAIDRSGSTPKFDPTQTVRIT
jgi:hypothetical protein